VGVNKGEGSYDEKSTHEKQRNSKRLSVKSSTATFTREKESEQSRIRGTKGPTRSRPWTAPKMPKSRRRKKAQLTNRIKKIKARKKGEIKPNKSVKRD